MEERLKVSPQAFDWVLYSHPEFTLTFFGVLGNFWMSTWISNKLMHVLAMFNHSARVYNDRQAWMDMNTHHWAKMQQVGVTTSCLKVAQPSLKVEKWCRSEINAHKDKNIIDGHKRETHEQSWAQNNSNRTKKPENNMEHILTESTWHIHKMTVTTQKVIRTNKS